MQVEMLFKKLVLFDAMPVASLLSLKVPVANAFNGLLSDGLWSSEKDTMGR